MIPMKGRNRDRIELASVDQLTPWLEGRPFEDWYSQYKEDGYVIFKNVMSSGEVERVRKALAPHLTHRGRNNFEGFKSNRVYALLAKAPEVFSDMASHPLALAFAEAELGPTCLMSALLAINLLPGETVQDWHRDDGSIPFPAPRPTTGVSTFWAIDDMTEENGATEIVPGSHRWTDDTQGRRGLPRREPDDRFDPRERDVNEDPDPRVDAIKVIMPAGSLMVANGHLLHRGGANKSKGARLIVTPQYCPGWARQIENMMAAVPREIAATLPARTRQLMGYSIHGAFMGYVDGVHPETLLGIH
jgi:ectoine hydroxylase-related dioxygenase (phytanoyl-CoA dioxygenase family)